MLLIRIPRTLIYGINNLAILIGQFLHENWSIKTEIPVFLELFSQFFSTLLWPDPRAKSLKLLYRKEANPYSNDFANNGMKMYGLYLAVLTNLCWFPLRRLLPFPRLFPPLMLGVMWVRYK